MAGSGQTPYLAKPYLGVGAMPNGTLRRLKVLGLTGLEERVYLAMVREPGLSAAALARAAGVEPERMQRAVGRLVRLRLVRREPGGGDGFVPAPPDMALSALVHRCQAELAHIPAVAEQLVATFREGSLQADPGGLLEVVRGQDEVADRFQSMLERAQVELLILDSPPYSPSRSECEVRWEETLLRRGVRCRVVYAQAALEVPGRAQIVQRLVALGERARVLPRIPIKLAVVDGRTALLPLGIAPDAGRQCAIVVYRSALLSALGALFGALWDNATPLPSGGPPSEADVSPETERMLFLLAAGLKDEVIARQLAISPRTVRRRLAQLQGRLGARTRFQAGLQAAKRGWL